MRIFAGVLFSTLSLVGLAPAQAFLEESFRIPQDAKAPDGAFLAVGDESCDIWLYDLASGARIFHNKHHDECWLCSVAWAPDNETFLFGCRPNAHAGKPALHLPLARAEAARTQAARLSRASVLKVIDAQMASAGDEKQRQALAECKARPQDEEKADSVAAGFPTAGGVGIPSPGSPQPSAPMPTTPPSSLALPKEIQKLLEQHHKTLDQEVKNLQRTFCINQWRVLKKRVSRVGRSH